MGSFANTDCFTTFCTFRKRLTQQLGQDAAFYLVLGKNGQGTSLTATNDDAVFQQFTSLVQDEQWRPLGIFALSLGGSDNEFGEKLMKAGTPSIRIERFLFQQPTTSEDAEVFAEAIAAEVKRFSSQVAPR